MTFTTEQTESIRLLLSAIYHATDSGLLDILSNTLSPDIITAFCDAMEEIAD